MRIRLDVFALLAVCVLAFVSGCGGAQDDAAPAGVSFQVSLASWSQTLTVGESGEVSKTWLTRKPGEQNTTSTDPSAFDSHMARGQMTDAQKAATLAWVEKNQDMLFGLSPTYFEGGQQPRDFQTLVFRVGERSQMVRYVATKLPAEAAAAMAEISKLLEAVPVTERAVGK